jgi:hypothetical protein
VNGSDSLEITLILCSIGRLCVSREFPFYAVMSGLARRRSLQSKCERLWRECTYSMRELVQFFSCERVWFLSGLLLHVG